MWKIPNIIDGRFVSFGFVILVLTCFFSPLRCTIWEDPYDCSADLLVHCRVVGSIQMVVLINVIYDVMLYFAFWTVDLMGREDTMGFVWRHVLVFW